MSNVVALSSARHEALINREAERGLLGLILTKPEILAKLPSSFDPSHYAVEGHADIHRATVEVGVPGVPAAIAVMQLIAVDDPDLKTYIASLLNAPASYMPAMVGQYADVITDMHRRRQIVAISEAMRDGAFGTPPAAATLAQAQIGLEQIGEAGPAHSAVSLLQAMDMALERADEASRRHGPAGISTGFPSVDDVLGGLEPGTLTVLAGRPAMGKAQPLSAKILLADGSWTTMGQIQPGARIASVDGEQSRVLAVHERGEREVFAVTMSDGRSTLTCADHLWRVMYRDWSEPRTISTAKLAEMLTRARYKNRLSIDQVSGNFGSREPLPLDPYVLGVLLGDGSFAQPTARLTSADPEIVEEVQARLGKAVEVRRVVGSYAYSLASRGVPGRLIEDGCWQGKRRYAGLEHLGAREFWPRTVYPILRAVEQFGLTNTLSHQKFVPAAYLSASRADRLDLLRGLMDTDGWAEKHASVRFSSSSLALAEGVQALVRSLGGTCSVTTKRPFFTVDGVRREGMTAFVCRIRHPNAETFFLLKRKAERAVRGRNPVVRLNVASVVPAGHMPVRCITVTHPSRLYVTDDYTVTHNSALGHTWAINAARSGVSVLEISLEMSAAELGRRSLATAAGVPVWTMKKGQHGPYVSRLIEARRELADLKLTIEDGGGLTASTIAMKARAARRRHGLGLIMIDHLHIVRPEDNDARHGPTWAIGRISGAMKRLAKELEVPVLLLAQLNRGVEGRDDKRPGLADLRASGDIEQDADAVGFVYRAEYYLSKGLERGGDENDEKWAKRQSAHEQALDAARGKADLIFAKVRDGQPGTIPLLFDGETTSFAEVAQ